MIAGGPGTYLLKTMTNSPAQPDLEALLAHSRWVRSLAGSLLADSSAAEDVEQEVWLQALKSPPKHIRNIRGWLATVVRNTVAQRGRSEGRNADRHERLNRESDSSTGAGPHQLPPSSPRELAERSETFQALARAIGELQEPYSSAIYLRFVEELSVAEVALRQEVGVPTATSRIQRGVELLRAQMQGRFGDSWRARCLVFTPLASRAAVPLVTAGVIAMSLKTKILISAGLLAFFIPVFSQLRSEGIDPSAEEVSALMMEVQPEGKSTPVEEQPAPSQRIEAAGSVENVEEQPVSSLPVDDPRALQVSVRDAITLKPVSAADVLYFDRASAQDGAWTRDQFAQLDDMETLLDRYGKRFTTNADGHVSLPARKSFAYIGARTEGKFASIYLYEDPSSDWGTQVELLLRPVTTILVKVIDQEGRPVPNQQVEYQNGFGGTFAQRLVGVKSDEKGIARFRNIQERLADGNPNNLHRIALPIPGGVVAHEFPLRQPPTGMITLQLPQTGDVRILLRDPEGKPARNRTFVQFQAYDPVDAESHYSRTNALRGARRERSRDGEILFKDIALDTTVVAWLDTQGRAEPVEVIGTGPVVTGEEVVLTLRVPPTPSVVDLLIVDSDAQPLQKQALDITQVLLMEGREIDPIYLRVGTDGDGHSRFRQERLVEKEDHGAASATMMSLATQAEEGCARWGVKSWPALLPAGEAKLGEFVVGAELISSGVVYDEQDQPMPFAEFNLRIPAPWPNGEEHQNWLSFKADAEGRFRVFGEGVELGSELKIDVSPPTTDQRQYVQGRPRVLIVGQLDHALRVKEDSKVEGRVMISPEVPHERLQLTLELTDGKGGLTYHFLEMDPTNGRFSRGSFLPGLAQLVLKGPAGIELARSEHFRTDARGELIPGAWKALDLRGRLFVHRVQVKGADGGVPDVATVKLTDLGLQAGGENPVTLVTAEQYLSVAAEAAGYRPNEPRLISGQVEIELAVGVPVIFVLPEGVKLPEGAWEVHMRDAATSGSGPGNSYRLESMPGGRSWACTLAHPGTYMVGLACSAEAPDGGEKLRAVVLWSGGRPFTEIQVSEGQALQTIQLEVTQEAVDSAKGL